jgi:IrrE N-terminal-like domain
VKVGFLSEEELETVAIETLGSYGRRFEEVLGPPVPVEEILECDLELDFGLEDLAEAGLGEDALGAIWAAERRVRVDSSLDPTEFPVKEGRYRFTVGHEVGHWQLHRHLFLANVGQDSLFGAPSEPSVVCRARYPSKPPIEWQADAFAAHLLMPKHMVAQAWEESRGTPDPLFVDEGGPSATAGRRFRSDAAGAVTWELSRVFRVSLAAMKIRLGGLGLLRGHARRDSMFG